MKLALQLLLVLTLLLPGVSPAADRDEPAIYVIKQGDTLWGLSERFIKDPNYWPDMWSKNSQITNPHLIYPGQKVRIFPDRLELVPREESAMKDAVRSPLPAPARQLAETAAEQTYTVHGSEGFILENGTKPAGTIIGIHSNRNIAGDDDIVYTDIGRELGVKGGERYSVFRREGIVSHPVSNEILGTRISPLGTIQLSDLETRASRAIVIKANQEITPGSFLLPARSDQRREIPLKAAGRDLKGYIVSSYSGSNIIAAGDIVYIDLGKSHGAEAGNMLYVVRDVAIDGSSTTGYTERLPQELLGALVILETGNRTSAAIIIKSIDAIYNGDRIISRTR